MERARAWTATVVAALVVLVGCGDGVPTMRHRVRVDLSSGIASIRIPLSGRRDPLIVAAGDRAVVFGGFRIDGSQEVSLDDGVVFDVHDSTWNDLGRAPFDRPPYHPAGVWTGSEVVIVGTPCGPTTTEIYEAQCVPGGASAVAYSPATNSWRRLPAPTISRGSVEAAPLYSWGVGWMPNRAVFGYEDGQGISLVAYEPATSAWLPMTGTVDSVTADPSFVGPRTGRSWKVRGATVSWTLPGITPGNPRVTVTSDGGETRTVGAPWPSFAAFGPVGDLVLIAPTDQRDVDGVVIGLLDPARLIRSASD